MTYQGLIAETLYYESADGTPIESYYTRPLGPGPFPSVIVIHHAPGWDEGTKEIARTFAHHGYVTIAPHLYTREQGKDGNPEDAVAVVRANGGVPDARFLKDMEGALSFLSIQPYTSGKIGVIGYCSGGRHTYLMACSLKIDAAIDCYGGRVVAGPEDLTEMRPVAPIDLTAKLDCPLLGLFGEEDQNPSPEHVEIMRAALTDQNKNFEFHSYPGAGHAFFTVDRPNYRVDAAVDGWQKIFSFYGRHLC